VIKFANTLLILVLMPFTAHAATYDCGGGNNDYTGSDAVGTCANAVSGGDTCQVYTGTYNGWTQTADGSGMASMITVTAASGQSPTINGSLTLSTVTYFEFSGFTITSISGEESSYIRIVDNTIDRDDGETAISLDDSDYILISDIIFQNVGEDCVRQFGDYWIIRNSEVIDNMGPNGTGNDHNDFWQSWDANGNNRPNARYALIENNEMRTANDGNSHFGLINDTDTGTAVIRIVTRYNKVWDVGSTMMSINAPDQHADTGRNVAYNNTTGDMWGGSPVSWQTYAYPMGQTNDSHGINNLFYDAMYQTSAKGFAWESNCAQSYNLYYDPDGTMTFTSLASTETGAVKNQDPLLTSPTTGDYSLASNSPARDAGGPLTHANGGDGGSPSTSLTVDESVFFSDGWGMSAWSDVQPDEIAIGTTSNTVAISSINYTTNVITLGSPMEWDDGDPIYLYKDSDGTVVLYGSAPDIGAMEYEDSDSEGAEITGFEVEGFTF
jgi:hypothetical protein